MCNLRVRNYQDVLDSVFLKAILRYAFVFAQRIIMNPDLIDE